MKRKLLGRILAPVLAIGVVAGGTGSAAMAAEACALPTPLPVPTTQTVVGTGTAASCTDAVLRSAVKRGGLVTFDCGGAATIRVTGEIPVTATTVVDGGGVITLDGGGANRILVAQNGRTLSVRRLTFVNGAGAQTREATGPGGAVAGLYQSTVEVIDSQFRNNTAGYGGGAVAVHTDSRLTISGSTFTGNQSWYGGAVFSLLSPLTVVNSTFTGNSTTTTGGAGDGGAIGTDGAARQPGVAGGEIRICGSAFRNNTGYGSGGAAYLWAYAPDKIIVQRSTFSGNAVKANASGKGGLGGAARLSVGAEAGKQGLVSVEQTSILSNTSAGNGGAFYVDCNPACDFTNDTFHGNTSATYGGAIFGDRFTATNTTFAANSAGGHGGALFGSGFQLTNTVFAGNSAGNPWGQAMSCSSTGTGSRVVQWLTTAADKSTACVPGATAADPKLAAPADNGGPTLTMMPAANSPILNAGSACPAVDQRGEPRDPAACDLGAVERATALTGPASGTSD
jgi:predicted outer membrane repeat protein